MPLSTDWLILNAQSCWLVLKKIKIPRRWATIIEIEEKRPEEI